ncbi:MAG: type II-B CRISPR-associated RNA-guided endonuclease Cas9/Csx12, partial [Nitrospira sp. SB0673_bin_12]|nr:type II-B CRISPR-associated RNA-guided endonuclease Cas9/Csx12 [Nitrospira sp. SB0673_bin_12]
MPGNLIISPISIDLGAKNTGVYFAHYPEGSSIEEIEKEGRVYQLEKDSYTLLMAHRTARRHQRRGFDRRQMVKRLFKLIWEKHFGLEWDKNVQQTTSFLFNRRGFSFLTEEYDVEVLSRFPEEAYEQLPEQLKIDHDKSGLYNFADALSQWTNSDNALEKIRGKFHRILFKTYCEKIRKCWKDKTTNDQTVGEGRDSAKLGNTPKDIFEELFQELPELKERIETEEYTFENKRKEKVTARYNRGEAINVLSVVNNNSCLLYTS